MQFKTITAVMAFCATLAIAAPSSLEARTGSPSPPDENGNCSSGDNYCKGSDGWKKGGKTSCDTGDVYCCAVVGLLPVLNCINIQDITVNIPIDIDILKV